MSKIKEVIAQAEKTPQTGQERTKSSTISIPKKRPDYKQFEANNWVKEQARENETIQKIDQTGGALWLSSDGDIYFRTAPEAEPQKKEPRKAEKVLGNLIDKRIRIMRTSDPDITELDLIMINDEDFDPHINQEFFKTGNIYKRNLFKPTPFMLLTDTPKKEPKTILRLMHHLVSNEDAYFERFLNWYAYLWQTMRKPTTAIVLLGTQGTGKGVFFDDITKPLFGQEQTLQVNNSILKSNYLAPYFRHKIIINLDEISEGSLKDNKRIKNLIKPLITNQEVTLDEKHTSLDKGIKATAAILITSNEHTPIEIEVGDRRFNVFPSNIKLKEVAFLGFGNYENLKAAIDAELEDFARYLYHYPVDPIKANEAMMTPQKQALIEATNDKFTLFAQAIINKDLNFFAELEDKPIPVYNELRADFAKNRIKKKNLTTYFNLLYDEEIKAKRLMKELKLRFPQIFGVEPIKSNGERYFTLP